MINKNDARTIAIKLATEKGWRKDDVYYLTKDGDSYIFGLYMPSWGDFGAPVGVKVSGTNTEIIDLNLRHMVISRNHKIFPEFEQKLREMIARCEWTFAKTMPFAPHEYIVKDKCPLTDAEFMFFVDLQRSFGVNEQWGKYINPYLYIDDYKYWTMGAPMEETTVINRAKACVVDDAHKLFEEMMDANNNKYVEDLIHKKLGLIPDNKGYNINLLSGRLGEIETCAYYLRQIRSNYCSEVMKEWSQRLSEDFPDYKKVEDLGPASTVYTGITLPYKDNPEAIAVRIEIAGKSLYYGLTYMPETKAMRNELQDALSFVNDGNNFIKGSDWLYYKYVSFEDGYERLKELIERMIKQIL